jgi:hypothetical protein
MKILEWFRDERHNSSLNFFLSNATTYPFRLRVPPPSPGSGWSITDFWGWGARKAQLRCPDYVSDDYMCERGVPGGTLNLSSTSYPDYGRCGDLPLQGNISTAEPIIEPGTSWLVVRSSDHQATWSPRLIWMGVSRCRLCGPACEWDMILYLWLDWCGRQRLRCV